MNALRVFNGRLLLIAALSAATLPLGCRGGVEEPKDRLPVYPVSGTVTYNGAAVEKAIVKFTRQDGQMGATGLTDEEGRFTLTTYEAGDGAPEGEYLVSIMKVEVPAADEGSGDIDSENYVPPPETSTDEDAPPPPEKHLLPKKYANPAQSGLTASVKKDGPNEPVFELKD